MAETLWVGLLTRCERLSPYGRVIEYGVLVMALCLFLVWGGLLILALYRSPCPLALLLAWCRHWVIPLLFIGMGLLLIGNGDHNGVGRWLDAADMWVARFVMDSRSTLAPQLSPSHAGQPVVGGAPLHCPDTYAGLEVQGCMR